MPKSTSNTQWQKISNGKTHWWTDTWLPEIVAISFSFLCLAALIIVLIYANGSVIQVWNGLTLNTLVSILAAASKASALLAVGSSIGQWKWCIFKTERRRLLDFDVVDRASLGPLGCLQLFWHTRRGSLLWIGAVTVIAAIAFEPFSQQLVQYDTKILYNRSPNVFMPFANRYSLGQRFVAQTTVSAETADLHTIADFSMQSAILYGLDKERNQSTQQLSYQCPSRNCAWEKPLQSLAVCSRCNDITGQMKRTANQSTLATTLMKDNVVGSSYPGTRLTLPNGLYIDGQNGWIYNPANSSWIYVSGDDIYSAVYMTSFGTGDPSLTNTMQSVDTLIWAQSMIRIKPNITDNGFIKWPNIPLEAMECGLYYCVNNYSANITNGTLIQTTEEDQSIHRNAASWLPQGGHNVSRQNSLDSNASDAWVARSDLQLGDSFNVSQAAVESISAYMYKTFTHKSPLSTLNGWFIDTGNDQVYPAVNLLLYNKPDMSNIFQSVATSMSNVIRAGGDGALKQEGQIVLDATIYRVEWRWISLPLIVLVLGLVQLALSMIRSKTTQAPIWKNSSLAVLSRGKFAPEAFDEASTLSSMEATAKSSSVTLFPKWLAGSDSIALTSRNETT